MCALCGTSTVAHAGNFECSVGAAADAASDATVSATLAGELQAPSSVYSYQQIADYLRLGFWVFEDHQWIDMDHGGSSATISYNIEGLTAAGQQLALSALQAWMDVCNVTFVPTSGTAELSFDDNYGGAYTGWTFGGSDGTYIVSSYINVGTSWLDSYGTGFDSYSYQTYIHEIGHALGLGHAGPYNGGGASYAANAIYANDTWQYSIMSYWAQSNFDGGSTRYVLTPQIADVLAVQIQYGAATNTRPGNTVYGFHATAGTIFDFAAYASAPALTIYDNGGQDTLDCSGYSANQIIDLRPGSYSSIGGLIHNIGIALNTIIESAIGGSGNDVITGSGSDGGVLHGLAGNDTIMAYSGNLQVAFGDDENDQLYFAGSQNQLFGSDGNDWLGVSGNNNSLAGGAGDDWIGATGSLNTLNGQDGSDALVAYGTGNFLHGSNGNDWLGVSGDNNFLNGRQGNDYIGATGNGNTLDGGAGTDHLSMAQHVGATFVFHLGYQQDDITGFAAHVTGGSDQIDLRGYGLTFAGLINSYTTQLGSDCVIDFRNGDVLTLHGVQKSSLGSSDFLF
jgi:Peptidase M10 serralysin C terminal/Metallo-peptidase family M12B Reprolysin-like